MRLLLVACVAAVVLAACDDGPSPTSLGEADPVRVGFLVSGVRTYLNGAMIAVDEVNGRGGLLGRTVELVVRMGLEEAEAAVEAAETMIGSDQVVALIGPNRSSHAIEVGAVAQRHRVPMITTAATNPGVTAAGDLVFMAAFTDQFQGRVMAEFAAGTLGVTTAAVLTERGNVYSEGIGEFFIDHFRGSGGVIVAEESFERDAMEFALQLERIAAATPDAVFVPVRAEDVALLAVQARALPVHDAAGEPALFLGADAWDNAALLDNGGAAVEGSFFSSHFSPDTDEPTARTFVDAYLARYAIPPTGGDAVSYDAVRLFLEAAARAGSLDADAVRREILATRQYAGATRISHYNGDRHPTKSAVIMTIENGVKRFYQQVDP
ncbi:MAG: ABC transporter substrate-binding protein [Gammaproteobacteria bacterium]|nr:ABC transporter substrate-binding protein [Gammaproteobacteria bacterium]MDE2875953.1 ABC transporter substrate-binding protein [Gemmatimonadota bacterium]